MCREKKKGLGFGLELFPKLSQNESNVCASAAKGGQLEVLKWGRANGGPLESSM